MAASHLEEVKPFKYKIRPNAAMPKTAWDAPVPRFHGGVAKRVLVSVPTEPATNQSKKSLGA